MSETKTTGPRFTARRASNYSLLSELKLQRGAVHELVPYDEDGQVIRKITVPDIHNRHVKAMEALDTIPWETVDLLDKKGNLLKRHKRNADDRMPAGDLEELAMGPKLAEFSGLLSLMLKAQDVALSRQSQGQHELLHAHVNLLDRVSQRLETAEQRNAKEAALNYKLMGELLQAQFSEQPEQLVLPSGEGEGEGDGQTMTGRMLDTMMPKLIMQWLSDKKTEKTNDSKPDSKPEPERKGPKSAAVKNGANGHAAKSSSPPTERQSSSAAGGNGQGTS